MLNTGSNKLWMLLGVFPINFPTLKALIYVLTTIFKSISELIFRWGGEEEEDISKVHDKKSGALEILS